MKFKQFLIQCKVYGKQNDIQIKLPVNVEKAIGVDIPISKFLLLKYVLPWDEIVADNFPTALATEMVRKRYA